MSVCLGRDTGRRSPSWNYSQLSSLKTPRFISSRLPRHLYNPLCLPLPSTSSKNAPSLITASTNHHRDHRLHASGSARGASIEAPSLQHCAVGWSSRCGKWYLYSTVPDILPDIDLHAVLGLYLRPSSRYPRRSTIPSPNNLR